VESISCFILQVHLNHIDAVVQLRPSMPHVISGRAYNRQALQSREMNGGASGSKAPSRKVWHNSFCRILRFSTICCSKGLLALKLLNQLVCSLYMQNLLLSNIYNDYV